MFEQGKASEAMDSEDLVDDSDGDDDSVDISAKQRRKLIGSFHRLKTWYNNQYPSVVKPPVPSKKSGKKRPEADSAEQPPLIIVLEDFEAFSATILQKFVQNIRLVGFYFPTLELDFSFLLKLISLFVAKMNGTVLT